jgi:hypothetical protein
MADLGGADAEGEGAERAVGAGVAVAADDGLAGLRDAELGSDDVHDAAQVLHAEQLDAEVGAVLLELRICLAAESMVIGAPPNTCSVRVGVAWSMVASVRSGRRIFRPRSRSSTKACGEVTSWVRCRSM